MIEFRPWLGNPRVLAGQDGTIIGPSGKPLRGRSNGKGYLQVEVSENGGRPKNVRVHRIVCETWHGPRPTPEHEVAHEDGDKSNNATDNLRWATCQENRDDMRRHHREGRYANRKTPVPCKLAVADVHTIRAERAAGTSADVLAERFGISPAAIQKIARRARYAWLGSSHRP